MIEVLVSDLGQVLLPFDFSPSKEFLRKRSRTSGAAGAVEPWSVLSELHDSTRFGEGGCSSREFFERVAERLGLDASFEEFCDAWCDVFREDEAVLDLVRRARVAERYILSNTNDIHWQWIRRKHPELLAAFDRVLVSQELHALKPHPEIFRHVERISGRKSDAHLLIDDLRENVEGALACGWKAILFTDAPALQRELETLGLLD